VAEWLNGFSRDAMGLGMLGKTNARFFTRIFALRLTLVCRQFSLLHLLDYFVCIFPLQGIVALDIFDSLVNLFEVFAGDSKRTSKSAYQGGEGRGG
jgi:hypothetical protein